MVHIPSDFEAPVVPELGEFERELDLAILAVLPDGCKVNAIAVHGASHWALSHRIDTSLPDGTQQMYFLKVLTGKLGQEMAQGEYEGNKAIHAVIPRNVPRPVAHGTYTKNSDRHFFLSTFHEMEDEMPPAQQFVSVVAELHQKSVSPTGKFGFHVTTHAGNYPLQNSWCDSWEEFFVRQLKTEIIWERGVQGQNDEMDELYEAMFKNVIPRLLRPLQTGGRSIKPSLVHGDLWHGNVGVDMTSDEPILYDPCATYAHNEYDMTSWRAARYRTNRHHQTAYHKFVEISQPVEDCDDRNALYALRNNITVSAQWPANKSTRQLHVSLMIDLEPKVLIE
ncbi:hypothetical protein L207DRAFT_510291 [Hyaloscypha variabilis F]|uniref:protein-ribulosamine 3-kinase n=1 Tax=Hyaloscypha variabilis (strain UAMH 11265 / GT02V1 / F) TaxID=1149755 RepID=A0A2J6RZ90_HYAVF|nr:hypothetical protein L207DRAFT_510291 [Hyaloscypha variabilis F]